MSTSESTSNPLDPLSADDLMLERALAEAVRQAYLRHRLEGQPVIVWEDGRIKKIPAEEIVVPPKLGE